MSTFTLDPILVSQSLELAEKTWGEMRPAEPPPVAPVDLGPLAWYVLQTTMHGEDKVCKALAELSFEAYTPMMRKDVWHRRQHRLVAREFRMFNRYVFAHLPAATRLWRTFGTIEEIDAVLGDYSGPVAVPEADIARFRAAESARQFDVTKDQIFPVGSRLRVLSGPFGGFAGLVESFPGRGLVKAMVEVFARATPVTFPFNMVEPE